MNSLQQARERYKPNARGVKERDGFVCSEKTMCTACVAVKRAEDGVHIRDTKDAADATLSFTNEEWKAFIEGVKNGEFDV
jgi:putative sterol carrier protein